MQRDLKKKLQLKAETLRSLDVQQLGRVVGGISGLRGCHTINDVCHPATSETLCGASNDTDCVSGLVCP